MNTPLGVDGFLYRQSTTTSRLCQIILYACLILSLIRTTNMGLFYPSAESQLASIDYSAQIFLNLVLLAGLIVYVFLNNNYSFIKLIVSDALIFLLCAAIFFSIFVSLDKKESIKHIIAVVALSVPSIIYLKSRGIDKLLETLSGFMVIVSFVNLLYVAAFPQYGIMSDNHEGRWRGLFEHKNGSGPFFAISFFIIFHQIKIILGPKLIMQIFGMGISLLFVAMSGSSTGYVSFGLMAILYPLCIFMYRRPNPLEKLVILLISASSMLLIFSVAGPAIMEHFFGLIGRDATLTGRTNIWAPLVNMSLERPLLGYGIGMSQTSSFMELIRGFLTFGPRSTHNSYLDIILDIGYPGALIFLLILLRAIFKPIMNPSLNETVVRSNAIGTSILIVMMVVAVSSGGVFLSRSMFWLLTLISLLILYQVPSSKKSGF